MKATAVDQRGMSAPTSMGIRNVVPYTVPTVRLQSLYRCDSGGTEADGGTYYSIRVVPEIYKPDSGTMSDNAVTSLTTQVGASGGQTNLQPDVTTLIGPVLTNPDSAYTILVSVQDRVGVTTVREFLLTGAHHDFVLRYSNGHTHLGIGMAPEVSGLSCDTIQLPAGGKILIGGTVKLS